MTGTSICSILGIRYPILQGGMLWIADANLASSVSNAGALGVISPYASMEQNGDSLQNLRNQIWKTRQLTQRPFAVNVPLDLPDSGLLINLLLQEGIRIVVTAAGNPGIYTELLHSCGAKVLHVISSAAQAKYAESCGVDAVIAAGSESGGRIGREEIPLGLLIPQVALAVSIPIIAAGGIVDTHEMRAAMAVGAHGVQLGTRFIASTESIAHPNYKRAIVEACETDTVIAGRLLNPARRLRSSFAMKLLALESSGASVEIQREFVGVGRARKAQIGGDLRDGDFLAGTSAGKIKSILPVVEIIDSLIGL